MHQAVAAVLAGTWWSEIFRRFPQPWDISADVRSELVVSRLEGILVKSVSSEAEKTQKKAPRHSRKESSSNKESTSFSRQRPTRCLLSNNQDSPLQALTRVTVDWVGSGRNFLILERNGTELRSISAKEV